MFCRKCGKTLLDGDRFCSYCGAQVIERNGRAGGDENLEEVIYNDSSQTVESLGIGVPKKSIVQKWQERKEGGVDKHPTWNLEGFPIAGEEARKTEEIVVDWTNRHVDTVTKNKSETGFKIEPVIIKEQELNQERQTTTLECKDLLEKGDTRIFEKSKIEENPEKKQALVEEESITDLDLETELFGRKTNLQFEPNQADTDSIEKFYTFSKKNEEFQKLLDKEYERLKKGGLPERKEPLNLAKLEIQPNGEGHITGIEKILQEETKAETPEINTAEVAANLETKKAVDKHQFWSRQAVVVSETPKTENIVVESVKSGLTAEIIPEFIPPVLGSKTSMGFENEIKANDQDYLKSDAANEEPIVIDLQDAIEDSDLEAVVLPWDESNAERQEFVDEDANRKKISPVKVILSVVILLLVVEIGILGVKYFFPESGAAALINERLGFAANWVDFLKDSSDSKKPQEENDKKTEEDAEAVSAQAETDQTTERDLKQILDSLLVYNDNIKSISVNEKLVYDESKDYGDKNINNSTPIEDNIWYQDKSGNNVYFDSEIFKTLICFDSLWIDYINGKNKDVLAQTKEGSIAYNNAKNYSKLGKISEVFNTLELGEMRKGNNGYYIWAKEEIQVTEKSIVTNRVINYIYYLEPVEQELKVVNYIEY